MNQHFFTDAPVVSWTSWLWRKLRGTIQPPSLLQNKNLSLELPDQQDYEINKVIPEYSTEYSDFLRKYYYFLKKEILLDIPPKILQTNLRQGKWTGIELRLNSHLCGLVISQYAGDWKTTPMGLVTWLCIIPSLRKKGIVNLLLRSLYAMNQPTTIYWWRTDGWLQSPCPPVYSDPRILRKKQSIIVQKYGRVFFHSPKQLQKVELSDWFLERWITLNPNGILLYNKQYTNNLLDIYEYKQSETQFVQVAIHPTFEVDTTMPFNQSYCEVVAWAASEETPEYDIPIYIETILDHLVHYSYFEAPSSMPHLDRGWKSAGTCSWSVLGLDSGTAQNVPILALAAV